MSDHEKSEIAKYPAKDGKDWARQILMRIRDGCPPSVYAQKLARDVLNKRAEATA